MTLQCRYSKALPRWNARLNWLAPTAPKYAISGSKMRPFPVASSRQTPWNDAN
jgi:hypothetical protein